MATVFPFQMEDPAGQGGLEIGKESFRLELNEARAGARMRAWARAGGGGRAI